MVRSRTGFTLIELIVVMLVFMVVILITGDAFKVILTQMAKVAKSEESNIEGVVGLEMFRHDIQQAGYGLPFSYLGAISYYEAGYAPANTYNDGTGATTSAVPRAIVAGDELAASTSSDGSATFNVLAGTDYLVLKGASLGMTDAAQRWTYMPYSSGITGKQKPRIWESGNLVQNDRVIVLKKTFSGSTYTNQLMFNTGDPTIYWANYDATGFADTAFLPTLPEEVYYVYGLRSYTSGTAIGMPFNRVDYFVARPATVANMPAYCAANTGILYKGSLNHATSNPGGRLNYIPLLDCVADMQVILGWDLDDGNGNEGQDGKIDTYSTPLGAGGAITVQPAGNLTRVTTAMADPERLRNGLKQVKVYLLVQNGRRDAGYTYPGTTVTLGNAATDGITKTFSLSADARKYRWKTYQLVVSPKNLVANQ